MKKFLSIVGIIALLGVVFLGVIAYNGFTKTNELSEEAKVFSDTVIPKIFTNWDINELNKNSDNDAIKKAGVTEEQTNKIFNYVSNGLGKMLEYHPAKDDDSVSRRTNVNVGIGKEQITSIYIASGKFEKGEAKITLNLTKNNNEWKILGWTINSPVFLNNAVPK